MGQIRAETVRSSHRANLIKVYDNNKIESEDYSIASSPAEIINSPDIDAVCVCTPNNLNLELTITALRAGKHVLCEKPPAFSANDVKNIIAEEIKSGKKLMYGFNHRHHKSIKKMKEIVDSGDYGRVLWLRGRYGKSVDDKFFDSWRSQKNLSGGGILIDQGIHMIDLFLHLADNFHEVKSTVSNLYWKIDGVEDNVFAIFNNHVTGVVASLHSTMTQWRHLFSLKYF